MRNGETLIVATVGSDGVVAPTPLTGNESSTTARVQVACDSGLRMSLESFRNEMARGGTLFHLVTRYAEALVGSIIQTAACECYQAERLLFGAVSSNVEQLHRLFSTTTAVPRCTH